MIFGKWTRLGRGRVRLFGFAMKMQITLKGTSAPSLRDSLQFWEALRTC